MGLGVWPGPGACGGSSWVPKPCGWQGGGVGAGDPAGPVHEVGQPRRPAGPAPGPTRSVPAAGAPALRAGGGGARADADADAGARPERGEAGPEPGAPGPAPGEGTRPGVWAAGSCRLRCRRRAGTTAQASPLWSSRGGAGMQAWTSEPAQSSGSWAGARFSWTSYTRRNTAWGLGRHFLSPLLPSPVSPEPRIQQRGVIGVASSLDTWGESLLDVDSNSHSPVFLASLPHVSVHQSLFSYKDTSG
ncbi:translation initiation factor IF-2-like isoform X2 [Camelus ferus]|uniref:Translation initiation factor IF-2-like isoform X2 n=1 Tax=Camelus ferus TaxID=419612 RepID=A0A8B8T3N7_CAMFR|nr:translation initiation factor IF-2-like isoform X2 [Camelus ferus]